MKVYHIFNGDCLAIQLRNAFPQDLSIIWRECFIEGPVSAKDFWEKRFQFLSKIYGATLQDFEEKVNSEFQKFQKIEEASTLYFWLEDDLFCQLNFWFLLSNLPQRNTLYLYRVFPKSNYNWDGFSNIVAKDANGLLSKSIAINHDDLALGQELWQAFQNNDLETLKLLSQKKSLIFRRLKEVIAALIDLKKGKTQQELQEINAKYSDFDSFFNKVKSDFGVYGFGDSQVKNLL